MPRILAILLLSLAAGCAGTRTAAIAPPTPIGEPDFPAAAFILTGLEIDPTAGPWRMGDRALLGITVSREGKLTTLYMLTELVAPRAGDRAYAISMTPRNGEPVTYSSPYCRTRIRLYDDSGRLIQESDGAIPTMVLNCGPYEAAMAGIANADRLARGEERKPGPRDDRACIGFIAFLAFGESSGKNKILSELVGRVVRRPTLLGFLMDRTLSLSMPELGGGTLPDLPMPGGPPLRRCIIPLVADIGGSTAVRTTLTLAPSCPPIGLVGGVMSANIRHPTEPDNWAQVRLLAARRGEGAVWPPPQANISPPSPK